MDRRRLVTTLICFAALGPAAGTAAAADCADTDLAPSAANVQQVNAATLCLLNEQRAAAGVPALTVDARLTQIASGYAGQLVGQRFFAHVSPSGQTLQDRFDAASYHFTAAGENLAWGTGILATPAQIVKSWMNSESHRTNVLDPDFHQIGLGLALGAPIDFLGPAATYVNEFGTPAAPAASSVPVRPHTTRTHTRTRTHARARARTSARAQTHARARASAHARTRTRAHARAHARAAGVRRHHIRRA